MVIITEGKSSGSSLDSFEFHDVSLRERVPNCVLCLPITHVHVYVVASFYSTLQGIKRRSLHGYVVHIRCLRFSSE